MVKEYIAVMFLIIASVTVAVIEKREVEIADIQFVRFVTPAILEDE